MRKLQNSFIAGFLKKADAYGLTAEQKQEAVKLANLRQLVKELAPQGSVVQRQAFTKRSPMRNDIANYVRKLKKSKDQVLTHITPKNPPDKSINFGDGKMTVRGGSTAIGISPLSSKTRYSDYKDTIKTLLGYLYGADSIALQSRGFGIKHPESFLGNIYK